MRRHTRRVKLNKSAMNVTIHLVPSNRPGVADSFMARRLTGPRGAFRRVMVTHAHFAAQPTAPAPFCFTYSVVPGPPSVRP